MVEQLAWSLFQLVGVVVVIASGVFFGMLGFDHHKRSRERQ